MPSTRLFVGIMIAWAAATSCSQRTPQTGPVGPTASGRPPASTPSPEGQTPTAECFRAAARIPLEPQSIETLAALQCPRVTLGQPPTIDFLDCHRLGYYFDQWGFEQGVLDFVNLAGPREVAVALGRAGICEGTGYVLHDVTLDGAPDLAIAFNSLFLFYSRDGAYASSLEMLSPDPPNDDLTLLSNTDLTLNGVPDLVVSLLYCGRACLDTYVYEWDGSTFRNLTEGDHRNSASIVGGRRDGPPEVTILDTNGDGSSELILRGGIPTNADFMYGPWREETWVYRWNGNRFVPDPVVFSQAEYRFQAVQDADRAALAGDYQAARDLYGEVITNDQLLPWSRDLSREFADRYVGGFRGLPTPTDLPPDPTERDQLRPYAEYRLILLLVLEGRTGEAGIAYSGLRDEHAESSPGHPYVQLASVFWEAFETSSDLQVACGRAIEFASLNPSILEPLGSDYHGWQSHDYVAADVCPFR